MPGPASHPGGWGLSGVAERVGAGGGPIALTYVGSNTSTSGLSDYTFTDEDIGAAGLTVVVVNSIQNGSGTTPPTMTIGGAAADEDAAVFGQADSGNRAFTGIFSLATGGGTATIVVDFAGTQFDCTISVFSLENGGAVEDFEVQSLGALPGPPFAADVSVDTVDGGAVISSFCGYNHVTPGITWDGTDEDFSDSLYGQDIRSVASSEVATGETPRTVTGTSANSGNSNAAVAVSYAPA